MQQILYQNYKEDKGSFKNTLKNKEVEKAVTLHPVKDPNYQYRIYNYLRSVRIMKEYQREIQLHRDIAVATELLRDGMFLSEPDLGKPASLFKFEPQYGKEVIPWEYFTRSIFSQFHNNPKRGLEESVKQSLDEIVSQIIVKVNKNAHLRGRTIEFKEIQYGYRRLDPMHGPDYIVDLLLTYRKYRGRKMSMNVRRHAYLQQAFLSPQMLEFSNLLEPQPGFGVKDAVMTLFQKMSWNNQPQYGMNKRTEHIDIIMPLKGRFHIFQRFMSNFENECLIPQQNVRLVLVLYQAQETIEDFTLSRDLVRYYQDKYDKNYILVVETDAEFSRGPGLQLGAEHCALNSLLFFVDVDIIFSSAALERIRLNTRQGSQVYFPIVFSQYDPEPLCHPGSPHCHCVSGKCVIHPTDFSQDTGYWRQFGFGIASMYRSDYHQAGGFDLSIRGWGKEDVDLYTKFIENNAFNVFRAVDPGMTHIFHAIICDENLEESQMIMCINTKAQSYGSTELLANFIHSTPGILRRLDLHHINHGS